MFNWLESRASLLATICSGVLGMYGYIKDGIPLTYVIVVMLFTFVLVRMIFLHEKTTKKLNKFLYNFNLIRYTWAIDVIKYMDMTDDERKKEKDKVLSKILEDLKSEGINSNEYKD